MIIFGLFAGFFVMWALVRTLIPLSEWARRGFWAVSLGLLALPSLLPLGLDAAQADAWYAAAAGLVAGELGWQRGRRKWLAWQHASSSDTPPKA